MRSEGANLGAPNTIADFTNKTAFILGQFAAAIHASDTPQEPGLAACGTDLSWCTGDVAGATFSTAWLVFHDWSQPKAQASTQVVQENVAGSFRSRRLTPTPGSS